MSRRPEVLAQPAETVSRAEFETIRRELEALRRLVVDRLAPPAMSAPPLAGLEDRLTLVQVAKEIGRSPRTIEGWLKDPTLRAQFKPEILVMKRAGRWESSRAMLRDWRAAMAPPASIRWPLPRPRPPRLAPAGPRRLSRSPAPNVNEER